MRVLLVVPLFALAACQPDAPETTNQPITMDQLSRELSALLTDGMINARENAVLRRGFDLAASRGGDTRLIDSADERKEFARIVSASTAKHSARQRLVVSFGLG
ncbi:hypothetical protein [Sphingomonas sp.]|uniref:hypothetical protein n=1 Tax=Sphingomonas sp. TaxID=28214 RepID=UPI001B0FD56D|nr:hypothetical protein [Sphingomonas sp.]MBO9712688.1 hypothetical protein [Sphingomonas sp.]